MCIPWFLFQENLTLKCPGEQSECNLQPVNGFVRPLYRTRMGFTFFFPLFCTCLYSHIPPRIPPSLHNKAVHASCTLLMNCFVGVFLPHYSRFTSGHSCLDDSWHHCVHRRLRCVLYGNEVHHMWWNGKTTQVPHRHDRRHHPAGRRWVWLFCALLSDSVQGNRVSSYDRNHSVLGLRVFWSKVVLLTRAVK